MVLISNIVSLIRHTPGSQTVGEQRNRGIPRSESLPSNSRSDHIDEQEARSECLCGQATLERHRMNHASSSNLRCRQSRLRSGSSAPMQTMSFNQAYCPAPVSKSKFVRKW